MAEIINTPITKSESRPDAPPIPRVSQEVTARNPQMAQPFEPPGMLRQDLRFLLRTDLDLAFKPSPGSVVAFDYYDPETQDGYVRSPFEGSRMAGVVEAVGVLHYAMKPGSLDLPPDKSFAVVRNWGMSLVRLVGPANIGDPLIVADNRGSVQAFTVTGLRRSLCPGFCLGYAMASVKKNEGISIILARINVQTVLLTQGSI